MNMVILRDFNKKDIRCLVELLNNNNVTKYLTSRIPEPYTVKDAKWWVKTGSKIGIVKAIEEDGVLVGCISVITGEYENNRSAEIGYWLGEKHWGKGIATDAVNNITSDVFSNTNIIRLFAPVFDPNKNSINVLKKCGYIEEGILKKSIFKNGKYYDEHLYAKTYSSQ